MCLDQPDGQLNVAPSRVWRAVGVEQAASSCRTSNEFTGLDHQFIKGVKNYTENRTLLI